MVKTRSQERQELDIEGEETTTATATTASKRKRKTVTKQPRTAKSAATTSTTTSPPTAATTATRAPRVARKSSATAKIIKRKHGAKLRVRKTAAAAKKKAPAERETETENAGEEEKEEEKEKQEEKAEEEEEEEAAEEGEEERESKKPRVEAEQEAEEEAEEEKTTTATEQQAPEKAPESPTLSSTKSKHAHEHEHEHRTTPKETPAHTVLEHGHIYFFYRPKLAHHEVSDLDDVQKLYMVLKPTATATTTEKEVVRVISISQKRLPDTLAHEKYWSFVDAATSDVDQIAKILGAEKYETKTRGERHVDAARPVGEGVYMIVMHHHHSHLVYVLELPTNIGEAQEAMNIEREGSFVISVKNPTSSRARVRKEPFPPELQERFENRQWNTVDPVDFLNYKGAEILLIGAARSIKAELGDLGEELEDEAMAHMLSASLHNKATAATATTATATAEATTEGLREQLFRELHLRKKNFPIQPLLTGEWV